MSKVKPFSYVVRFDVAPLWTADGFVLSDETAHDMLASRLGCATMDEVAAKVITAPSPARILHEQGYTRAIKPAEYQEERQRMLQRAPSAFIGGPDASLLFTLLNVTKAVREGNTAGALQGLTAAINLVSGESPISDIEWQPTPE